MARASTVTLLSLDRFAKILGINPLHFAGAFTDTYFPLRNRCDDLWVQYSWQDADVVGREDLAYAIRSAEIDIANQLGWFPAPMWVYQEIKPFERHYRRDTYRYHGKNVRGQRVSVKLEYAKLIAAGRRAADAIDTGVTVVYSDEDGDGLFETATVTAATTLTNVNEIFCFWAGESGAPEWEIREPRRKQITGGNVVFTYYSWQLIDPALWEAFPRTDTNMAIDLNELVGAGPYTNVVSTVDVYRVYNDTTAVSAQLMWEPDPLYLSTLGFGFCAACSGTGCQACTLTTQDGCLHVRDPLRGIAVPTPATYNSTTGVWDQDQWTNCREPDLIKMWYYAGMHANDYLAARVHDPLPDKWAYAIAQLATARTERDFCTCGNVRGLTNRWRTDISIQGDSSFQTSPADFDDPIFGTRIGGIMAARTVRAERHRIRGGGAT